MDMTGGSVSSVTGQVYSILRHCSRVCSDYYPETMGNTLMVNTPFLFYGCWSIIKNFLDERTRQKIRILNSNYLSTIEEFVEIEKIPTFLGGKCTCSEHAGGCAWSNIGPWNDYTFINNRLVRKGDEERYAREIEELKSDDSQAYYSVSDVISPAHHLAANEEECKEFENVAAADYTTQLDQRSNDRQKGGRRRITTQKD